MSLEAESWSLFLILVFSFFCFFELTSWSFLKKVCDDFTGLSWLCSSYEKKSNKCSQCHYINISLKTLTSSKNSSDKSTYYTQLKSHRKSLGYHLPASLVHSWRLSLSPSWLRHGPAFQCHPWLLLAAPFPAASSPASWLCSSGVFSWSCGLASGQWRCAQCLPPPSLVLVLFTHIAVNITISCHCFYKMLAFFIISFRLLANLIQFQVNPTWDFHT